MSNCNMTKQSISIAYDGEALKNGSMDVQELAPALIALAELFQQANIFVNGDKAKTIVNVKSEFIKGSFEIQLDVVVPCLLSFLGSTYIQGASNLATILGFVESSSKDFVSLISLIKASKGNLPQRFENIDQETIKMVFDDKEITVTKPVGDLFIDIKSRNSVENILKPLRSEGIETFKIKNNEGNYFNSISKDEVSYFNTPDVSEKLIDEKYISYLYPVSINFKDGNKWKFSDNNIEFWAIISDDDFVSKIKNNEISFSKSDIFKVEIHKIQSATKSGLETIYEITKILEHRPAKQLRINFDK